MNLKRVVVTGLGALTPIGNNKDDYWNALVAGKSGCAPVTYFDTEHFKTKFACELKNYDVLNFLDRKDARKTDKFAQYAMVASDEAIIDAKLNLDTINKLRVGVIWGAGIGGIDTFQNEITTFAKGNGVPRFNPFFIPKMIADIAPGNISIKYGFMGPNYTTVSACASSANAIIDALNYIRLGHCDVIVTGGSEAGVNVAGMGGFNAMHALSTRNDSPESASRPFDSTRDGFVLGEGSGTLILEEYEHAINRGARIYAELKGYGLSGDAHHITSPSEDGDGGFRSMSSALRNARLDLTEISYVNAHGTSTPAGDEIEIAAVERLFKNHCKDLKMSSTKSSIGHLLGAAGSVEAIFSILTIVKGELPATLNLENICTNTEIDLLPKTSQKAEVFGALSNSFGFGGTNASLIFTRI